MNTAIALGKYGILPSVQLATPGAMDQLRLIDWSMSLLYTFYFIILSSGLLSLRKQHDAGKSSMNESSDRLAV